MTSIAFIHPVRNILRRFYRVSSQNQMIPLGAKKIIKYSIIVIIIIICSFSSHIDLLAEKAQRLQELLKKLHQSSKAFGLHQQKQSKGDGNSHRRHPGHIAG